MRHLNKGNLRAAAVSKFLLLLVTLQAFVVAAYERTNTGDTINRNRQKRQVGDLILMGYKAEKALPGHPGSGDFFNQIGKKRSSSASTRRDGFPVWLPGMHADAEGFLVAPEEFQHS
ncbi:uncharacterized protein LOC127865318 [Dreissena polymorpha]|nr:uncharacterized protein LOC127865318 [Dreissena polymorpha]